MITPPAANQRTERVEAHPDLARDDNIAARQQQREEQRREERSYMGADYEAEREQGAAP